MKQYIFLIISFLTISLVSSAQDYNDISDNGTFATENTKRDKKFGKMCIRDSNKAGYTLIAPMPNVQLCLIF